VRKFEWLLLSKVKKLAEELMAKYPTLFSANFEANKKALDQVAIIRNRALRNQIAGAIAAMASELRSEGEAKTSEPNLPATLEEKIGSGEGAVAQQAQ
jgi:small subunit ribosomal protein S17e